MQDVQASSQIMRFPGVTRVTFHLRILRLNVTRDTTAKYDALLEWLLASVIAMGTAGAVGLVSPDETGVDPALCRQ